MKGLAAVALGIAAGMLAERTAVKTPWRPDPEKDERFGEIRGQARTVIADDGTELYAEVHGAKDSDAPTMVFTHGYCLNQHSWHHQRKAFRGKVRMVFWDHRGHGRSAHGPKENNTIEQLGFDLQRVIETLAEGPVVLVGHSMGGITMMGLAADDPDFVRDRVAGSAFIASSAGELSRGDFFSLPAPLSRAAQERLSRMPSDQIPLAGAIEMFRTTDLNYLITRRFSFGTGAPESLNRFTLEMLNATPISTIVDFLPALLSHDKYLALAAFADKPAFVAVGDLDALTPLIHTQRIVERLRDVDAIELPDTGHMILLERYEEVNAGLRRLLERV